MKLQKNNIAKALTLSFCISLSACSDNKTSTTTEPSKPKDIEIIQADLAKVQTGSLNTSIAFTGTIQPVNQTTIQSQVSATALVVLADVGQYVNKGQTLVRLNNQDNSARLSQAQANLASAKAQAELNLSVMQRKANLLQQGFISKLEYEQSQLEYRAQQENVKAMQANVDIAQKASQDTVITSPISGYITQRSVDTGQTVALGQTLFEVVDTKQVEIKANLPASNQQAISLGQKVSFNIQGSTQQNNATVIRISPVANQISRNIEFFAKPDNNSSTMSIGSFVDGQVLQASAQSGQLIPLKSLQNPKDQPYVWVIRDKKLIKTPVTLLQLDERQELALVSGLMASDLVSLVRFNDSDNNKPVRLQ